MVIPVQYVPEVLVELRLAHREPLRHVTQPAESLACLLRECQSDRIPASADHALGDSDAVVHEIEQRVPDQHALIAVPCDVAAGVEGVKDGTAELDDVQIVLTELRPILALTVHHEQRPTHDGSEASGHRCGLIRHSRRVPCAERAEHSRATAESLCHGKPECVVDVRHRAVAVALRHDPVHNARCLHGDCVVVVTRVRRFGSFDDLCSPRSAPYHRRAVVSERLAAERVLGV